MEKTIYILLCGETCKGYNPLLTARALEQAHLITLPIVPEAIIIGTGYRHLQMLNAVMGQEIEPTSYSPLCGTGDIVIKESDVALLDNGKTVQAEKFIPANPLPFLNSLENGALLVADREFLVQLGYEEAEEGMIVKIENDYDGTFALDLNDIKFETIFNPNSAVEA